MQRGVPPLFIPIRPEMFFVKTPLTHAVKYDKILLKKCFFFVALPNERKVIRLKLLCAVALLLAIFMIASPLSVLADTIRSPEDELTSLPQPESSDEPSPPDDPLPEGKGISSLSEIDDPDGKYYLTGDISLTETYKEEFRGTLDGNGKTVVTGTALFRRVKNATIKNLTVNGELDNPIPILLNTQAKEVYYAVIAIVANGTTTFENITSNVPLIMDKYMSGVSYENRVPLRFGVFASTSDEYSELVFINCKNTGDLTSTDICGGIFGSSRMGGSLTLVDCRNDGEIHAGGDYAGGLIALLTDLSKPKTVKLENCTNIGRIEAPMGTAGGMIGKLVASELVMQNCINNGHIYAKDYSAGIAADVDCKLDLTKCRNNGEITKSGVMAIAAGGIVARLAPSSEDGSASFGGCRNQGKICHSGSSGGILGIAESIKGETASIRFTECMNSGMISPSNYAGGMAGQLAFINPNSFVSVRRCINSGDVWAYIYASQLVTYSNSVRNVIHYNVLAGKLVDANSNPAFDAKLTFLTCSDADALRGSFANNFAIPDDSEYFIYSNDIDNTKNRIVFEERPKNSVHVVSPMTMASGEIAFRLNQLTHLNIFRQTIGKDRVPTFDAYSETVTVNADGLYVNSSFSFRPEHTVTDPPVTTEKVGIYAINPALDFIEIIAVFAASLTVVGVVIFFILRKNRKKEEWFDMD